MEEVESFLNSGVEGGSGDVELLGDLGLGVALEVVCDYCGAVVFGECVEFFVEDFVDVVPDGLVLGFGVGHILFFAFCAAGVGADLADGFVCGYAMQPGAEVGGGFGFCVGEFEEAFLYEVFGFGVVFEDAEGCVVDHGLISCDDFHEGLVVAFGFPALQQYAVVFVHGGSPCVGG